MNPVTGLSLGRIAVGIGAIARPDLVGQMLGVDRSNAQWPYIARMFGGREIALGTVTLLAAGTARRNLVLAGMAVDATDAMSGLLAIREKSVNPAMAVGIVGAGLGAVVSGAAGLKQG